jgi:hypothetical protein
MLPAPASGADADVLGLQPVAETLHQVHVQIGAVQDDDFVEPVAAGVEADAAGGAGFDADEGGNGDLGADHDSSSRRSAIWDHGSKG